MIGGAYMSVQSILPYTFKLLDNISEDVILGKIEGYQQSDERIILELYSERQIEGTYIFMYYYKESVFDYEANQFKTLDSSRPIAVQFHMNLDRNSLDIWGGKKHAQKLVTALSLIFENRVILEPYDISFEKALSFLKTLPGITVGTVKIEDVAFDSDIIASCTFNLVSHHSPFTVLAKYAQKISKITVLLNSTTQESDVDSVSISIYQSGAIVVYKNRDQLSNSVLDRIQELLEMSRRV